MHVSVFNPDVFRPRSQYACLHTGRHNSQSMTGFGTHGLSPLSPRATPIPGPRCSPASQDCEAAAATDLLAFQVPHHPKKAAAQEFVLRLRVQEWRRGRGASGFEWSPVSWVQEVLEAEANERTVELETEGMHCMKRTKHSSFDPCIYGCSRTQISAPVR